MLEIHLIFHLLKAEELLSGQSDEKALFDVFPRAFEIFGYNNILAALLAAVAAGNVVCRSTLRCKLSPNSFNPNIVAETRATVTHGLSVNLTEFLWPTEKFSSHSVSYSFN